MPNYLYSHDISAKKKKKNVKLKIGFPLKTYNANDTTL